MCSFTKCQTGNKAKNVSKRHCLITTYRIPKDPHYKKLLLKGQKSFVMKNIYFE